MAHAGGRSVTLTWTGDRITTAVASDGRRADYAYADGVLVAAGDRRYAVDDRPGSSRSPTRTAWSRRPTPTTPRAGSWSRCPGSGGGPCSRYLPGGVTVTMGEERGQPGRHLRARRPRAAARAGRRARAATEPHVRRVGQPGHGDRPQRRGEHHRRGTSGPGRSGGSSRAAPRSTTPTTTPTGCCRWRRRPARPSGTATRAPSVPPWKWSTPKAESPGSRSATASCTRSPTRMAWCCRSASTPTARCRPPRTPSATPPGSSGTRPGGWPRPSPRWAGAPPSTTTATAGWSAPRPGRRDLAVRVLRGRPDHRGHRPGRRPPGDPVRPARRGRGVRRPARPDQHPPVRRDWATWPAWSTADGAKWDFTHDALSRLTATTDPAGATWMREYDAAGNLIGSVDPVGTHHTASVDRRRPGDRAQRRPAPAAASSSTSWAARSPTCGRTAPRPGPATTGAGAAPRSRIRPAASPGSSTPRPAASAARSRPAGGSPSYEYNAAGRLAARIDARRRAGRVRLRRGRRAAVPDAAGRRDRDVRIRPGRPARRPRDARRAGATRYALRRGRAGGRGHRRDRRGAAVRLRPGRAGWSRRWIRWAAGPGTAYHVARLAHLDHRSAGRDHHPGVRRGRAAGVGDRSAGPGHHVRVQRGRAAGVPGGRCRAGGSAGPTTCPAGSPRSPAGDDPPVTFERDALGRPVEIQEPGSYRHRLRWDGAGRLVERQPRRPDPGLPVRPGRRTDRAALPGRHRGDLRATTTAAGSAGCGTRRSVRSSSGATGPAGSIAADSARAGASWEYTGARPDQLPVRRPVDPADPGRGRPDHRRPAT